MKKRLYVFDLDSTIFSYNMKKIPSQTYKLLMELHNNPNYDLCIATGRGPHRVGMIKDILHIFKFKIFINGAISYEKEELLFNNPIPKNLIKCVLEEANKLNLPVGFLGTKDEYITFLNDDVLTGVRGAEGGQYNIDSKAYLENDIYQLWVFTNDEEKKKSMQKISKKLRSYLWHQGGLDLVLYPNNKVLSLHKIKEKYQYDEIIAIGDGQNDIEMIIFADVGVAMDNSGFPRLKEKADLIAPHIEEDRLYDFFKKNNLI